MRILLVEDEKKVADIIARGLKAERYAVDVAHDGLSGWEMASTYDYDLAILDLMLPGMSGTELLEKIRRKNQQIPILILTARDSMDDKVKNFEAGADDYLTKPFAFAELIVRVKALLRRGPVNRSSVLRVGDLEIDRLSQSVRRAGKKSEAFHGQRIFTARIPGDASGPGFFAHDDYRTCLGSKFPGANQYRGRLCPAFAGKSG